MFRKMIFLFATFLIVHLFCPDPSFCEEELECLNSLQVMDRTGQKQMVMDVPDVELTQSEQKALMEGKHVSRLLDGEGDGKKGWLRFFSSCDPVTVWWIVTDNQCFAMEAEEFPATGSLTRKRKTFMPYTWENVECNVDDKQYVYQLLVMPLISPRKTNTRSCRNTSGLPWEVAWWEVPGAPCEKLADPKFSKWREKAVEMQRNRGSWRISYIPNKFRTSPDDLYRSDVQYFVDTQVGGAVGKMTVLAEGAQKQAMPTMVELIAQHCEGWERHMEKYHTPEEVELYRRLRREYLEAYAAEFGVETFSAEAFSDDPACK